MNPASWTAAARLELDRLLAEHHARLVGTGVDADEVIADLRRHVETELAREAVQEVDAAKVRALLEPLLSAPTSDPDAMRSQSASVHAEQPAPKRERAGLRLRWKPLLWFLWLVLPLATVGFESSFGICAMEIADPLRTPLHYAVLIVLPMLLAYVLATIERAPETRLPRLLGVVGFGFGVGLYFTVQLAQAAWMGLFGLIAFGLGLLALSPLLLTVSTALAALRLRRFAGSAGVASRVWPGVLAGLLLMVAIDARWMVTELGLRWAASNDVEVRERGVDLLRSAAASEEQLLRAGVFHNRGGTYGALLDRVVGKSLNPWDARGLFFTVTGKDFAAEVPEGMSLRARWGMDREEDGSWRADRASAEDLVLASSRLDGIANPDFLVGYVEWIAVVENHRRWDREGWATLQLPRGGVVSRVTLWIDGEEREAAFGGRAQTIRAYEAVTARRRDPLLVTAAAPDRVNLRFFPVPRQGSMKFRIGISFPMQPGADAASAVVELPRLLESNVFVSPKFAHEVWYEAHAEPTRIPPGLAQEKSPRGEIALRGALSSEALRTTSLQFHRDAKIVNMSGPRDQTGHDVRQRLELVDREARPRTLLVDGSPRFLRAHGSQIAAALRKDSGSGAVRLVIALDEPLSRDFPVASEAGVYLQTALRDGAFTAADGTKRTIPHRAGFDNRTALADGVRRLAGTQGTLIWLHGPQLPRAGFESVMQIFARRDAALNILELAANADRVSDWGGLEEKVAVRSWTLSPASLEEVLGGGPEWELVRSTESTLVPHEEGPRNVVSRHMNRLWAADEAMRMVRADASQRDAAMKLAIEHQLVTPLSGAVVLETQKQYDEHGLKPADPKTVPVVPEPQTYALMLAAMGGALLWRRWQLRRRRAKILCGT